MRQKILATILNFTAVSAFAYNTDQLSNTFTGGAEDGLSSASYDAMGTNAGGDQSVVGQLKNQGIHFYIGGGLGLSLFKGKMRATEGFPNGTPLPIGHEAKLNKKFPSASVMFGAQQKGAMLTDFGVMAMYAPGTLSQKTPGRSGAVTDKNTIQQKYSFGVYGGAGIPLTPSVNLFGKLGLVYTGFTIGYQEMGSTKAYTQVKNAIGVAPGIMLQYKMSETLSTHLDISYAVYQAITTDNLAKTPAGYEYKLKVSPRVLTVMLGGSIKLGGGN